MNLKKYRFLFRNKGVSLTSYGLLVGLISIAAIIAVERIGIETDTLFASVAGRLENSSSGVASSGGSGGGTPPPAVCASGRDVFNHTGAMQSFMVPAGCSTITARVWGAGGGGGERGNTGINVARGGAGSYVEGDITVTPSAIMDILVGGGGEHATFFASDNRVTHLGGFGGGGDSGTADPLWVDIVVQTENGAGGGGRSEVFYDSAIRLVAGGGGGAGRQTSTIGGAGGLPSGGNSGTYTDSCTIGSASTGGLQIAGGIAGTQVINPGICSNFGTVLALDGSAGTGGSGTASRYFVAGSGIWVLFTAGGGGGGYFGGGGGSLGGGSGGSSFIHASATNTSSASASTPQYTVPLAPETGCTDALNTNGEGGFGVLDIDNGVGVRGGHGCIVLCYGGGCL